MIKGSYHVDYMDPNPDIRMFDTMQEAQDWVWDEVHRRVDHEVQHSPYTVSYAERAEMEELEFSLVSITNSALGVEQ